MIRFFFPFFSAAIEAPSAFSNVSGSTFAPVTILIPFFVNSFSISLEISRSSVGKMRSAYSITVILTPKSFSMDAHSIPMTPPPTIIMDWGRRSSSNASSDVRIYVPSASKPGSIFGLEPIAIINCFGISMSFSSPFAYSTETVPGRGEKMEGPSIRPYPLNTSIFPFFIKWATPYSQTVNDSLLSFLHAAKAEGDTFRFNAECCRFLCGSVHFRAS